MTPRIISVILFLISASTLQAQQYYYVVIGVFANESNAEKFTGYVRSNRYNANYDFHSGRKLSYVYVLKTLQREEASAQAKQLQAESEFKDAWVFLGTLDRDNNPTPAEPVTVAQDTPVVEVAIEKPTEPPAVETEPEVKKPEPEVAESPAVVASAAPSYDSKIPVKGKLFRFKIIDPDGKIVQGSVHHVDYSKGRDIATYQSGEYLDMLPPPSANNPMTMVCAIFGYKEVVKEIDYQKPEETEGVLTDQNGAWVIPYKLVPLAQGDVSVMYRVSFYKDAVVMLPAAKAEMDQLVSMMTINPNYKIKIHGHCNGNNSRRIIALGPSKNYFEMKGSDERNGSAKDLTRLRAEAVQMYLMDHGIDKSRTEIYAWGGLNMLVSETGTSAKLNDRIEIEVLNDKP